MKQLCAICLLLFSSNVIFQTVNIRGLLKDAVRNEPIIAASIGIKNTGMGTISNDEGVFQLTAPKSGVVLISCLGYKELSVPVSDFKEETQTILLEQSEEVLEEVMVTKVPLQQVLLDIIAASKARFNKPIVLHTYYREFVKLNGKYKKFSDGLLDYHASGGTKKTKSDLIVKQNRSFSLSLPTEDEEQIGATLNVQKGISNSYSFEFLEREVINKKDFENYDFTLKSRKNKDGKELYVIIIEPKKEVEKSLYEGAFVYDPETKLIYDADLHFAESHKQYPRVVSLLGMHVSPLDIKFRAVYKMVNNNYVLSHNNRYVHYKYWTKKYQEITESRSDLIVTDFEQDDLTYNKKEVYKKKYLYDKPTKYTGKFWQKNNAIVITNEEEKVISSLEKDAIAVPETE
jgi:hypothetical protein